MDPDVIGVIFDGGSLFLKGGFAHETEPRTLFPTVIGRSTKNLGKYYVGDEVYQASENLKVKSPIENGVISNWSDMEKIWSHTFYNELRVDSKDQPVLLVEVPFNPKNNREKMTSIMFETFSIPSLYVGMSPVLSLYSAGKTSGTVFECGGCVSHSVGIYEGYVLPHSINRMNLAGKDVTDYLMKKFGYDPEGNEDLKKSHKQRKDFIEMKERFCYVRDIEEVGKKEKEEEEMEYELHDGKKVKVGMKDRYLAPEILFQPSLINASYPGAHECTINTIRKCDLEIRTLLYGNIVLSGGSTLFKGFRKRMVDEIGKLAPKNARLKAIEFANPKYAAWAGGSILSSLSSNRMWITKGEYDDVGATIVHRKCF